MVDFQLSRNVPESPFRVKTAEKANPDLLRRVRTLEEHSERLISAIKERTGWEEVDFSGLEVVVAPPRYFMDRFLKQFADCSKLGLEERISVKIRAWYRQFSTLGLFRHDHGSNQIILNSYFVKYRPNVSSLKTLCHELIHYAQYKRHREYFDALAELQSQALSVEPKCKDEWLKFNRLEQLILGRDAWLEGHACYLSNLIIGDFEDTSIIPQGRISALRSLTELIIISSGSVIEPERRMVHQAEKVVKSLLQHYCGQTYDRQFIDLMFENPCFVDVLFQPYGTLNISVPKHLNLKQAQGLVDNLVHFRLDGGEAVAKGQLTISWSQPP